MSKYKIGDLVKVYGIYGSLPSIYKVMSIDAYKENPIYKLALINNLERVYFEEEDRISGVQDPNACSCHAQLYGWDRHLGGCTLTIGENENGNT